MWIEALLTIAKMRKQTKCPSVDEGIKNKGCISTVGSSHKRGEYILPFMTMWVDLGHIISSDMSQTEKDKYCVM